MLRAGLTGGIASGKSTVGRMLRGKGAFLIDFDKLTHFVEEPDRPAWEAIVASFGSDILNDDRTIDRKKLGAIVFQDKEKLAMLNDMVHPAVFAEWKRNVAEIERIYPRAIVISDIPLLFEVGLQKMLDVVIVVYISPGDQIQRLIRRNGCSREEAHVRLASQMPIDSKISLADFVIDNSGSLEATGNTVDAVWEELLAREQEINIRKEE